MYSIQKDELVLRAIYLKACKFKASVHTVAIVIDVIHINTRLQKASNNY